VNCGTGDFLASMATASHRRLDRARAQVGERELVHRVGEMPPPVPLALSAAGFDLIAELKRRSPSAGPLAAADLEPVRQAQAYAAGGACALSVLTEPDSFSGDLAHLTEVARALPAVPVMRKDFLVGPYQVLEARAAGASGVLLIAAMLKPEQLEGIARLALGLGLFVLLEIFDQGDLARCGATLELPRTGHQLLLGVNCRDLRTLQVDFGRFAALAPALPAGVPWVAESGIESEQEAAVVSSLGYRLGLVGTALMRAGDPATTCARLLAAGRAARPSGGLRRTEAD
jgi:indole-3-glycerol phosphate synthase